MDVDPTLDVLQPNALLSSLIKLPDIPSWGI
jgi:hypothetical protein